MTAISTVHAAARWAGCAPRLSEVSKGRDNNLNLLRMLAALAAMISHAWPITLGPEAVQPLETPVGFNLGILAVFVFFAIPGFVVVRSFERQPSARHWLMARVLRIVPGLAGALLLTVLVLGPLVTTLPLGAYFGDPATPSYVIRKLLLLDRQAGMPGVFEGMPLRDEVDGPLWTLYYEVLCYGVVLGMGLASAFRSRFVLGLSVLAFATANVVAIATPAETLPPNLALFPSLALPFACGVAFYIARYWLPLSPCRRSRSVA